jgi:hypothetical protein
MTPFCNQGTIPEEEKLLVLKNDFPMVQMDEQ